MHIEDKSNIKNYYMYFLLNESFVKECFNNQEGLDFVLNYLI